MPILPAEPDRYPPELLSGRPEPGLRRWWVLHSKPRQEKSLARYLYAAGLEYFLPTIRKRNRIRGRIVTAQIPLFTGYVFLRADPSERLIALAARLAAGGHPAQFWSADHTGGSPRARRRGGDHQRRAGRVDWHDRPHRIGSAFCRPRRFHPARRIGPPG